jgi:hypothetical protein
MTEIQLGFADVFSVFKQNLHFEGKVGNLFEKRPDSSPKTEENLFMIKEGARIYPFTQRKDVLTTLKQEVGAWKTDLRYGKLSLFQLCNDAKSYGNGKTFSLKKNELIAVSSRDAKKIKI